MTSTSTVGLPRESRISRAWMETISVMLLLWWGWIGGRWSLGCEDAVVEAVVELGAAVYGDGCASGRADGGDEFDCGGLHLWILAKGSCEW